MVLLGSQSRKKGESKMAARKRMKRRTKEKSKDWSGNLWWEKSTPFLINGGYWWGPHGVSLIRWLVMPISQTKNKSQWSLRLTKLPKWHPVTSLVPIFSKLRDHQILDLRLRNHASRGFCTGGVFHCSPAGCKGNCQALKRNLSEREDAGSP